MAIRAGDKFIWIMPDGQRFPGEVTAAVEDGDQMAQFRPESGAAVSVVPLAQLALAFRVEIKLDGGTVHVRSAPSDVASIHLWDILSPGSVHTPTGWTCRDLKALGDGFHIIEKRTPKE
jgi:hypothetical protein